MIKVSFVVKKICVYILFSPVFGARSQFFSCFFAKKKVKCQRPKVLFVFFPTVRKISNHRSTLFLKVDIYLVKEQLCERVREKNSVENKTVLPSYLSSIVNVPPDVVMESSKNKILKFAFLTENFYSTVRYYTCTGFGFKNQRRNCQFYVQSFKRPSNKVSLYSLPVVESYVRVECRYFPCPCVFMLSVPQVV